MLACLLSVPVVAAFVGASPAVADEGIPDTVVFGGDAAYPPFEWLEGDTPTGFNIDLENAIAEFGNARAEHVLGDWPDIVSALENGDVDVVPMFRSAERERLFTFSSTFHFVHHAAFARAGVAPINSPADLAGRRIVLERSSYAHQRLLDSGIEVDMVLAANTFDALQLVVDGDADYGLLAVAASSQLIERHDFPLRQTGVPMWAGEYAFAVRKDRDDLAAWLRRNYTQAVVSGRYDEIREHWNAHFDRDIGLQQSLRNAAIVLVPLAVFAMLATLWSWSLRRRVRIRTRELRHELDRRRIAEEHLRHLADHDMHTGLPVTHSFIKRLEQLLEQKSGNGSPAGNSTVLVFAIAERDSVARTFGYDVAEHLVREIAERLQAMDYPLCGHLGRGRFVVYSDTRSVHDCFEVLSRELSIGDLELHPNIIGGSAEWSEYSPTAHALVRHAETALSVSIARKLQWTEYAPSMEPDELDLRLVTDFRKSAGRDLYPVFQPQIDLRNGRIPAAEALVRWQHPELGLVPPARFIPLLESAGLIPDVTHRMVGEAVRVGALLRQAGHPCVISVNIAAYDLMETRLSDIISAELERYGGLPSDLQLELTETSVAEDPDRVRIALQGLNELGLRICVDDFGTGHSSLSYLSSFPIQELKVDREFVCDMVSSRRNASIVKSTILMAHELGMSTVAEGAEDKATLDALRAAGCDRVQGYVIARPLPEREFMAFVADHADECVEQETH